MQKFWVLVVGLLLYACTPQPTPEPTRPQPTKAQDMAQVSPEPVKSPVPTVPSTSQIESGPLILYSYEETVTDVFLNGFRKAYSQVELKTAVFAEFDEALAKLRGGFRVDVINVCLDYLPLLVKMGYLMPIDTRKISHWKDVHPYFKSFPELQAGDNKVWMVPVDAGLTGIMYRTDQVDPPPTSWKALFDEQYKGKIAMEDYDRNAILFAALALGFEDPYNLTEEQLLQVKELLIRQKALLAAYFESDAELRQLYKTGDVVISSGWTADAKALSEEGIPVKFVAPDEGAITWVCGYAIMKDTKMPNAAHALIDHYLSPQLQKYEAEEFEYMVPNQTVWPELSPEILEVTGIAQLMKGGEGLKGIPEKLPKNYEKWQQIWEEVKAAPVPQE